MGDRANLILSEKSLKHTTTAEQARNGAIVLYSHWGGHEMANTLALALKEAQGRWDDKSYANRIVVSQFVGDEWNGQTGYGLRAGKFGDNERPILAVDWAEKMVYRFGKPGTFISPDEMDVQEKTGAWSFAEFIALSEKELTAVIAGNTA